MKMFRITALVIITVLVFTALWQIYGFMSYCRASSPEGRTEFAQVRLLGVISAYYNQNGHLPAVDEITKSNDISDGWKKPMKLVINPFSNKVLIISEGPSHQPITGYGTFPSDDTKNLIHRN